MIDDELLMAFVDGELDELSGARVERALAEDADLRARLAQQQRLRATLAAHYGPTVDEAVPEYLRAMLETNVVPLPPPRPRPIWQGWAALAASLLLGLALGRTLLAPAGGPVAIENGTIVARGALAGALDMQLASAQPAGAPVRIGISFAAADGRLCRTFDSAALSGLACRGDRGWQLLTTTAGTGGPRTGYRQAGSSQVLTAAQELMAGEAFDAAAERRARDSGWRRGGASR